METPEKLLGLIDETITKASRLHPKASSDAKDIINNLLDMRNLITQDAHDEATKSKIQSVGINDVVETVLNDEGVRLFKRERNNGWAGGVEPSRDGTLVLKMWAFMRIFGPFMDGRKLFKTNPITKITKL